MTRLITYTAFLVVALLAVVLVLALETAPKKQTGITNQPGSKILEMKQAGARQARIKAEP